MKAVGVSGIRLTRMEWTMQGWTYRGRKKEERTARDEEWRYHEEERGGIAVQKETQGDVGEKR